MFVIAWCTVFLNSLLLDNYHDINITVLWYTIIRKLMRLH